MAKSFLVFTWAPGFDIVAGFKTREEAEACMNNPHDNATEPFGDYMGIIEGDLIETPRLPGTLTENPFVALDLRPSELLVLAKEIAESSADQNDYQRIDWIKQAYEAKTGKEMECPFP